VVAAEPKPSSNDQLFCRTSAGMTSEFRSLVSTRPSLRIWSCTSSMSPGAASWSTATPCTTETRVAPYAAARAAALAPGASVTTSWSSMNPMLEPKRVCGVMPGVESGALSGVVARWGEHEVTDIIINRLATARATGTRRRGDRAAGCMSMM